MKDEKPGKTVLITGTSSGIGYAITSLLAGQGWIVFAGVRRQTDAEKLQALHVNVRPVFLDVTKKEDISRAVETIDSAVGSHGLDALVNNAGGAKSGPFEYVPLSDFEDEFRVNLFGVYGLTQAMLPLLRRGSPGRIINVSSFLGTATLPYSSAYCATKYALESLTISMRQELAPMGISVSSLGAGPVFSSFSQKFSDRYAAIEAANATDETFNKLYQERMLKAHRLHADLEKKLAVSSESVARQLQKMLTTSWLRHRYCDNYTTWFTTQFWAWLPSWVTDWLVNNLIDHA